MNYKFFDPLFYLSMYEDLSAKGVTNPEDLAFHYKKHGEKEKRITSLAHWLMSKKFPAFPVPDDITLEYIQSINRIGTAEATLAEVLNVFQGNPIAAVHFFASPEENANLYAKIAQYYAIQNKVTEAWRLSSLSFYFHPKAGDIITEVEAIKNKQKEDNKSLILKSGLFDQAWYVSQYGNRFTIGNCAVQHFLEEGAAESLNPSSQFDTTYYVSNNPDVLTSGINPLVHYIRHGQKEGRSPVGISKSDVSTVIPSNESTTEALAGELDPKIIEKIRKSGLFDPTWYIEKYGADHEIGDDPLLHYLTQGEINKFNPSSRFCARSYLLSHKDVADAKINPLVHYVIYGQIENRKITHVGNFKPSTCPITKPLGLERYYFDKIIESGLFDHDWYIKQYSRDDAPIDNPLEHYLTLDLQSGVNPSPSFNTAFYAESNPDVLVSDLHPFVHYVCQGYNEGRRALPQPPKEYKSSYSVEEPIYIPRIDSKTHSVKKAVRAIAFYLPQFHSIPENDAWWGEGFTEWTNVKPAKPQFEGHYQPHIPDDYLGYYSLLDVATQAKQVELAKQYGLEGFCFYLYWFTGQRLLEKPLDNYLETPSLDLPFCVCWANENWSRRWDGLDDDLLMVQNYSDEDDINFIKNISKYLKDSRYIQINGKPLLIIYRPNLFPDMKATAVRWREWCRYNGVGEIYLAYPQSFEMVDPIIYGFDAALEFPPNNSNPPDITHSLSPIVKDFEAKAYDWRVFLDRSESYKNPGYTLFRGTCPSWDNTARKKTKGTVFHNSSPSLFKLWLTRAFDDTLLRIKNKDEQIVFINAWNEWAEGAHLEPDQRYGYAWLQALRDAHESVNTKNKRIVLVSHDAHPHGAQFLCWKFARYFKEHFKFEVELIVLGDGIMLPKFREYANVHLLNLEKTPVIELNGLLSMLRDKGAEVAIVNTTVSGKFIPHLKSHGFNVVSLVHELPGVLNSYKLHDSAENIADLADKIVFPAQQVMEGFLSFINRPSLPNSIIRPQGLFTPSSLRTGANKSDTSRQVRENLGLPHSAKIILSVAYADYRKGFDIFIKACLSVVQRVPETYAVWVGHHDEKFVQESMQVVSDDLRKYFIFTGLIEQPQNYYLAADVYALTSREDPFPSVVMESLDALTPVVAFDGAGGFVNLLQRNCGILVPKENVNDYSEAIFSLLADRDKAFSMASTGKIIIENEFNFDHYIYDLLEYGRRPVPRVSVVVPNYKYDKFILQRLESISNQTFPIFELIILDDCSPDNSIEVIQGFMRGTDIPCKLIINESNSGSVFRQWQKGVDLASGDLIWIAEADDLAEENFVERMVKFFNDPEVVLGFSQSKQIDELDNPIAENYLYYTDDLGDFWKNDYIVNGRDEIHRALCIKNTIPNVSSVIFRRTTLSTALKMYGPEMMNYKVAGDWLLYLRMAMMGKIGFCAESLNTHRRHVHSVTKRNNHMSEITALQDIACKNVSVNEKQIIAIQAYRKKLESHFGCD